MAALQERNGSFRLIFWYHGKQHTFTIGQVSEEDASDAAATVGNLLRAVEEGRIHVPAGLDIVAFIRQRLASLHRESDATPEPAPRPRDQTTLGVLRDRYITTHSNGTIEENSLATVRLHLRHFCRFLGDGMPLPELSLLRLPEYIDARARKGLSPVTIRKEVATLRPTGTGADRWALLAASFPPRGFATARLMKSRPS